MENKSGILPVGHTVLVLPKVIEETTESGIVIATDYLEKEQMAQLFATVIAVSPVAWSDVKGRDGQSVGALVEPGDEIMIAKYAGYLIDGKDGQSYRLIGDLDVKAKVDKENK
jgi:co-chaperonin GroES (HSP10)